MVLTLVRFILSTVSLILVCLQICKGSCAQSNWFHGLLMNLDAYLFFFKLITLALHVSFLTCENEKIIVSFMETD